MEIRKLNTLRGLAAMIVVIAHYSNHNNWLDSKLGSGAGQLGVMIFFMLSGFLMSFLYLQKEFDRTNVINYVVARAARVLPLFLIVVFISYFANATVAQSVMYDIPDVRSLLAHLFLLNGESVLWTIAPEIQFYALFIVIWAMFRRWLSLLFIAASFIVIALFFLRFPDFNGDWGGMTIKFTLFRCLPFFIVGLILGHAYKCLEIPKYLRTNWFVVTLIFIPLLYPKIYFALTGVHHGAWKDIGVLLVLSLIFFNVVFLIPDTNRLIANKLGDFLGKISYSLYLLHMPILLQVLKYDIGGKEVTLLVFIGLCLLFSYISYRLIEVPASRYIRKLSRPATRA